MPDTVEKASSGRAKCRGCGKKIAGGELRFGESVPNQFADGETTLWFHLECGAYRRPEKLAPVLRGLGAEPTADTLSVDQQSSLLAIAETGEQHPRLARLCNVERAPSGRAKCRCCDALIEKGALRIGLEVFDDGRFSRIGFIHLACQAAYFGCPVEMNRTRRHIDALRPEDVAELEAFLIQTSAPPPR